MKIAIIDADLLDTTRRHRFPNLACMKISGFYKSKGDDVELVLDWKDVKEFITQRDLSDAPETAVTVYDKIFISKVFTDTKMPDHLTVDALRKMPNIEFGGTGFFSDKSPALPHEIEHHKPDYKLYEKWVEKKKESGAKKSALQYFEKYSIGFMTRGCVRQCPFCVNKNSTKVEKHSPVEEFFDEKRPFISLLDDNIFAYRGWRKIFDELQATGKSFKFKQGLDFRLMTQAKADALRTSRYYRDYIFAFDDWSERDLIKKNFDNIWKNYKDNETHKTKFYVLVGFDRNDRYDEEFWIKDMAEAFLRVEFLFEYGAFPYIMRHASASDKTLNVKYRWFYTVLANWCNQIHLMKFKDFEEVYLRNAQSTDKTNEFEKLKNSYSWFKKGINLLFDKSRVPPEELWNNLRNQNKTLTLLSLMVTSRQKNKLYPQLNQLREAIINNKIILTEEEEKYVESL